MGIIDSFSGLLGGKSSSTSAPSTVWGTQTPFLENLYNRAQTASYGGRGQSYAKKFLPGAQRGFNQLIGGGQQFDPTGLQNLANYGPQQFNQGALQNIATGGIPQFDQSGLQNIATGQAQNQNLTGAIDAGLGQINRNFQRNIMPGINQGAALTNTSGGSRQGVAQGLAASDANQQASDFVQNMMSQNYQSGLQNQLGAYNQLGSQAQQGVQSQLGAYNQLGTQANQAMMGQLGAYGQLGQQNQMANQAVAGGLGMAPGLSNLGFGAQYGDLSQLSNLIGAPTILGGGSQSSSTGGIGSSLGGLANMGALGYVMSDARLKENIKPVGTHKGFPLYSYNYKGDSAPQVGVIAQDVEITKPGAVKEFNGYKAVNYGEL